MFCKNCGSRILDNQRFCTECGTAISNFGSTAVQQPINYNYIPNFNNTSEYRATPSGFVSAETRFKTPKVGQELAITSFIMGLLSILIFYWGIFPAVLGTFFGCVSKSQGSKSAFTTAGIICSAVGAVFSVISLLLLLI